MKTIKKLTGPLSPKLAKKIIRYLFDEEIPYEDVDGEVLEFKKKHDNFLVLLDAKLSSEALKDMLSILSITTYDKITEKIIRKIKKIKDFEELISYFILTYKTNEYGANTYTLLKIIINLWLYKNGYSLIVIFPSFSKALTDMIDDKEDESLIRRLFIKMYEESFVRNTVFEVKTTEEVMEKLNSVKENLYNRFGIIKVSVFGSYARGRQSKFSDLDLYIESESDLTECEKKALDDYLSVIMKVKVNTVTEHHFVHYEMLEVFNN